MEKNFELMKDKNGRTMRTGDIVKIENAYFKNDNGLYYVEQDGTNKAYCGRDSLTLYKICKNGKLSTTKYNICFFPIISTVSDYAKTAQANAWNKEHATIEIVYNVDNSKVIEKFEEEARQAKEASDYYKLRGYSESYTKCYDDSFEYYHAAAERMKAEKEQPKEEEEPETIADDTDITVEGKEPETPTEITTESTETALTGEAEEVHAEAAETAGNGTDEPQERYFVVRILCADGTHTETVKALTPEEAKRKVEIKPHEHYGSVSFAEESELFATNPSPVSKSDTEETPEENSGAPSGDSKNYTMGSDNTEGKSDTHSGDEKSYTTKTAVKYYEISEETARLAHEAMSFRDYKKNSATDEYRASVDRAAEIAEKQKRKVSPYYHAKIDALLDKYARRLAEWTNACNRNRASCPSVMICGPANFPTKKKEKQNSREDTLWKEYKDIKGIIDKIKSVGTGAIDFADPHARELLQERLDSLKGQLELDKKLNAYWKKHKTFIGCPDISADFAEKLTKETNDMFERCAWMSKPFPDYNLASIRDKIKRTQARLDQLNTMQEKANDEDGNTETFDGGEIFCNYEQNRLQIIFNEKPDEETRSKLKSNGFRWSPRNSAWQRQLTANAERAARQVLKLA